MKQFAIFTLLISMILISSCKKKDIDYTNPKNLVGTEWKATEFSALTSEDYEYISLKFISTTTVQGRDKKKGNSSDKLSLNLLIQFQEILFHFHLFHTQVQ
ncbi:MAG: hypothetical protein RJA25_1498 [Bacteroidota bacterium]